jgi:nicotinamidase-related amidase
MLSKENTVLVVIDLQEKLLVKMPDAETLLDSCVRLVKVCGILEIPVLVTEQYPKGLGPTDEGIRQAVPDMIAIEKITFDCCGEPAFLEALHSSERKQALVVGIETHVCVCQTVLSLIDSGFETYVVLDAVRSRAESEREAGLQRMRDNGAHIVTAEMAIFELLKRAGTPEFKRVLPLLK